MMPPDSPSRPGLLEKLLTLIVGALLLVATFMFSLLVFSVAVVVGLMVWGYFWWKTRELRRVMREQPPGGMRHGAGPGGHVIEGEAVIVDADTEPGSCTSPPHPPGRRVE